MRSPSWPRASSSTSCITTTRCRSRPLRRRFARRLGDAAPAVVGTLHGTDVSGFGRDPARVAQIAPLLARADALTTVSQSFAAAGGRALRPAARAHRPARTSSICRASGRASAIGRAPAGRARLQPAAGQAARGDGTDLRRRSAARRRRAVARGRGRGQRGGRCDRHRGWRRRQRPAPRAADRPGHDPPAHRRAAHDQPQRELLPRGARGGRLWGADRRAARRRPAGARPRRRQRTAVRRGRRGRGRRRAGDVAARRSAARADGPGGARASRREFAATAVVPRYEALYRELLGPRPGQRRPRRSVPSCAS